MKCGPFFLSNCLAEMPADFSQYSLERNADNIFPSLWFILGATFHDLIVVCFGFGVKPICDFSVRLGSHLTQLLVVEGRRYAQRGAKRAPKGVHTRLQNKLFCERVLEGQQMGCVLI